MILLRGVGPERTSTGSSEILAMRPPRVPGALLDGRLAIHVALTGVIGWLGCVLAWPSNTFGSSPSYRVLAIIAPEEVWAILLLAFAFVGALGINSQGWLRMVSVLMLATAHGLLAVMFFLANPSGTATGTYAVLAGLGYYLAWRRAIGI